MPEDVDARMRFADSRWRTCSSRACSARNWPVELPVELPVKRDARCLQWRRLRAHSADQSFRARLCALSVEEDSAFLASRTGINVLHF
jgi:hypothetical protein